MVITRPSWAASKAASNATFFMSPPASAHCLAKKRTSTDAIEILLGLADALAADPGEVNLVEDQPQLSGHDPGRHCLACARGSGEEDFQALAGHDALCKAPLRVDDVPVLDRGGDFLDTLQCDAWED